MQRLAALVLALASPAAGAVQHVVGIGPGFNYTPSELLIAPGDTVLFSASGTHPLRSDDTLFSCNLDCAVAFPVPGEFRYYCLNHGGPGGAGMSGRIVVMASPRIHADGFEGPGP